jgi:hypothetical protein
MIPDKELWSFYSGKGRRREWPYWLGFGPILWLGIEKNAHFRQNNGNRQRSCQLFIVPFAEIKNPFLAMHKFPGGAPLVILASSKN